MIDKLRWPVAVLAALAAQGWPLAIVAQPVPPAPVGQHQTEAEDTRAIEALLAAYTTAVTRSDRAAFEALLLNLDVPFAATDSVLAPRNGPMGETRRYAQFRKAVFESGARLEQSFHNVRIQQDGPLAQVSLDFVTRDLGAARAAYGFKTLQLLKVAGQWKIASEFYTAYALPAP